MTWTRDALAKWGIEPNPDCPLCWYLDGRIERLEADLLEARLDAVDGPRTRVRELEINLERANALIAQYNGKGRR